MAVSSTSSRTPLKPRSRSRSSLRMVSMRLARALGVEDDPALLSIRWFASEAKNGSTTGLATHVASGSVTETSLAACRHP